MADALPENPGASAVRPADVARHSFDLERRGFDQSQVRAYLIAVAESLSDAQTREAEIRGRLGKAIRRAEAAEAKLRDVPKEDPGDITRQIGDEVTSVLDAARAAGEQRVAAAESSAKQLLANAKTEADKVRAAAETIMDERRAAADEAAAGIVGEGKTEAAAIVAKAQADADALRADAAETLKRARDEGDALIAEAERARLQVLEDMDRRRRQARAQVERLRVGRDRLLRSYEVVRRTLDESTSELKSSLSEAKVLGDTAARRVASESAASPAQLEAELADARLIGRTGPTPTRPNPRPATPAKPAGARPEQKSAPQLPRTEATAPTSFAEQAAPTPRRPVVGDPTVPKTPAVAPKIKPPIADTADAPVETEPGATGEPADDAPSAQPASKVDTAPSVGGLWPGVGAADPRPDEPPVDSPPAADATEAADFVPADDSEFDDLPEGELAIIEAEDEVEEVVALVDQPEAEASAEVTQSSPDTVAEGSEAADESPAEPVAEAVADAEPVGAEPVAEAGSGSTAGLFAALRQGTDSPGADSQGTDSQGADSQGADSPGADSQDTDSRGADSPGADGQDTDSPGADSPHTDSPDRDLAAAMPEDGEARPTKAERAAARRHAAEMAKQRDAIVAALTVDIEKRLKRALADEQNELLAGIRAAGKSPVELLALLGTSDDHLRRYVLAINEVANLAYGAGAALIDEEPPLGELPAGAVEELLTGDIIGPLRDRMAELDRLDADTASANVDSVRAFYRQRKVDTLTDAAGGLAHLLVTAGVCDALPEDQDIPWQVGAN